MINKIFNYIEKRENIKKSQARDLLIRLAEESDKRGEFLRDVVPLKVRHVRKLYGNLHRLIIDSKFSGGDECFMVYFKKNPPVNFKYLRKHESGKKIFYCVDKD